MVKTTDQQADDKREPPSSGGHLTMPGRTSTRGSGVCSSRLWSFAGWPDTIGIVPVPERTTGSVE
jgi:hypothetical protein